MGGGELGYRSPTLPVDATDVACAERGARAANSSKTRQDLLLLTLISLAAAAIFYVPFWFRAPSIGGVPFDHQGMARVYGMWDGPLYVTSAATLWDLNPHNPLYGWIGLPPKDYAERFPLYPLMIRTLAPALGYWASGLIINVAVSTAVTLLIYLLLCDFSLVPGAAFWVALASIFWPPRGFLYRYVAMSDPLFILGTVGAAYGFASRRYWLAGLFGLIAVAARPNGFLLVAAIGLLALTQLDWAFAKGLFTSATKLLPLLLLPATIAAILIWHQLHFGDWLASLHSSNFVRPERTLFPALEFFGPGEEGVPYLFILVAAGIFELVRRRQWVFAVVAACFFVPALFVPTDVSRYLLPALPFAFFLAGDRILASKPLRVALILSLPLIYVYAWKTMLLPGYQAPFGPLHALLP